MSKTPTKTGQDEPDSEVLGTFAQELMIKAALLAAHKLCGAPPGRGKTNVSRQSSSARGRKGTPQGARGIQAPDRREVRPGVLHHQPRRHGGRDLSHGGVAQDRGK